MLYKLRNRDSFWAFWFLLPSILGLCIFVLYPMASSLIISFTDYALLRDMSFVGIKNYVRAFTDATALKVFRNTLVFTLTSVPLLLILPLLLSIALNQKIRGIRFFRAA